MTTPTGILLQSPIPQVLSAAGQLQAGMTLTAYVTGTTDPTDMYADGDLTTSVGNVITANSAGVLPVTYLNPTVVYKFVLATAGAVTIQTIDPYVVPGLQDQAAIGAILYPQTAAESGLAITPTNYQYPSGYADRYGTNTTPGTTDMTAAIQAALNVAAVAGSNVACAQLLANTYLVSSAINVPSGTALRGAVGNAGNAGAAIGTNLYCNTPEIIVLTMGASATALTYFCKISDFSITFGPSAAGSTGVSMKGAAFATAQNIFMFTAAAISYHGYLIEGGSSVGCFGNTIIGGYLQYCHIGVQLTNLGVNCTSQTILGLNMLGRSGDGSSIGYWFTNASDGLQSSIVGGFVEGFNIGCEFNGTEGVTFVTPYFNGNTTDIAWSGTDTYNTFCGVVDLSDYVATGTPGITNVILSSGGVNGLELGTGLKGDSSSVAAGLSALGANTATSLNAVAVGKNALAAQTTGVNCTAVGENALSATTTQASNTAIGTGALGGASNTGAQNTAVGVSAASGNTSGGDNVAVGYAAEAGTSGSNNTAVGYDAAAGATGAENTALGSGATTATAGQNTMALGYGATSSGTSADNEITFGNSSIATLRAEVTSISSLSDQRDKAAIIPTTVPGLALINDLQVRDWVWARRDPKFTRNGTKGHGLVAQELAAVATKHGADWLGLTQSYTNDWDADPAKHYEVMEATPGKLQFAVIKALQELSAQNSEHGAQLAALEARATAAEARSAALEARLAALESAAK